MAQVVDLKFARIIGTQEQIDERIRRLRALARGASVIDMKHVTFLVLENAADAEAIVRLLDQRGTS